jgi:hypothetical protein
MQVWTHARYAYAHAADGRTVYWTPMRGALRRFEGGRRLAHWAAPVAR